MINIYKAEEWAEKKGLDMNKIQEEKKAKAVAAKKKRVAKAKQSDNYQEPTANLDKAAE